MSVPPVESSQSDLPPRVELEPQFSIHCPNDDYDDAGPLTERQAKDKAREHLRNTRNGCYPKFGISDLLAPYDAPEQEPPLVSTA